MALGRSRRFEQVADVLAGPTRIVRGSFQPKNQWRVTVLIVAAIASEAIISLEVAGGECIALSQIPGFQPLAEPLHAARSAVRE